MFLIHHRHRGKSSMSLLRMFFSGFGFSDNLDFITHYLKST